jgi:hypothetical protein
MLAGHLALVAAALFTGAIVYINVADLSGEVLQAIAGGGAGAGAARGASGSGGGPTLPGAGPSEGGRFDDGWSGGGLCPRAGARGGAAAGTLNVTRHGLGSGRRDSIEAIASRIEIRPLSG